MKKLLCMGTWRLVKDPKKETDKMNITLINVRGGKTGPVVYVWVDGKEVAKKELTKKEACMLISELANKLEK